MIESSHESPHLVHVYVTVIAVDIGMSGNQFFMNSMLPVTSMDVTICVIVIRVIYDKHNYLVTTIVIV